MNQIYNDIRYGTCILCGSQDAGPYDLCTACQDKPIPEYDAFHVGQLFSVLHQADISDFQLKLSRSWPDGDHRKAVQEYRDYCFSFGTPGRLYYNELRRKAKRAKDPTPGSPAHLIQLHADV